MLIFDGFPSIMPVYEDQSFKPSSFLENPHVQTILPAFIRKGIDVKYQRERITLNDGDFLDVDLVKAKSKSKKLVILLHGLESNSSANYITRMAYLLQRFGYDAAAVNFRGCSGEINLLFKAYHSGKTDDLAEVIYYFNKQNYYESIFLVGFSLGGNVLLKYMGESGNNLPTSVKAGVAISVPCDLASCSEKLQQGSNLVYARRFLKSLKKKVSLKSYQYPAWFDGDVTKSIKTLEEFDDWYTAPVFGYQNAQEYYAKNSSKKFLSGIQRPTLLINALDDPFLTSQSMPFEEAMSNQMFHFHYTRLGGHVGFHSKKLLGVVCWHEKKVISFLQNHN